MKDQVEKDGLEERSGWKCEAWAGRIQWVQLFASTGRGLFRGVTDFFQIYNSGLTIPTRYYTVDSGGRSWRKFNNLHSNSSSSLIASGRHGRDISLIVPPVQSRSDLEDSWARKLALNHHLAVLVQTCEIAFGQGWLQLVLVTILGVQNSRLRAYRHESSGSEIQRVLDILQRANHAADE